MAEQFFQSCKAGDLEAVEAALQDGLDVNVQGEYGSTGLMEALLARQSKVAIYLLKQDNIDVNIVGDIGQTALQYAAWDDATSECLAILLARSDLTVVNQGDTLGQTALAKPGRRTGIPARRAGWHFRRSIFANRSADRHPS